MSHSSEKRWNTLAAQVSDFSAQLVQILNTAEEGFQQMQEVYTYAGGTATDLAALLFKEDIEARQESGPNQEEIDKELSKTSIEIEKGVIRREKKARVLAIRQVIFQRKIKQKVLYKKANLSLFSLNRILNERVPPRWKSLLRIERAIILLSNDRSD